MPLEDNDFTIIRSWVGETPTDDDLEERFDRLGQVNMVIEETLRYQLAKLTEQPASMTLNDGTSVSYSDNINALRETLRRFFAQGGIRENELPNTVVFAKIHRANQRR